MTFSNTENKVFTHINIPETDLPAMYLEAPVENDWNLPRADTRANWGWPLANGESGGQSQLPTRNDPEAMAGRCDCVDSLGEAG